ncbi:endopolygalacturonase 2 [Sclerotinia borealis F-4128]|uniref:Endopolygalacturonase 2 n=1 Tax=Sclerotinia borealis (strain F-4128) TaxID=1432307 RepID=W9CN32_SCLBF|nr:endopolygalacturonase 2 [Sclerotinia borealis F-4128]
MRLEQLNGKRGRIFGVIHFSTLIALLGGSTLVAGASGSDIAPLVERADCTFTSAANAKASKTTCSTIILSSIVVPAGITLDLTGLNAGTKVIFQGHTTFGYSEWKGPLVSISGKDITVSGASGNSIDGGARWWDGLGSNVSKGKGKVKPKFFAAHKSLV